MMACAIIATPARPTTSPLPSDRLPTLRAGVNVAIFALLHRDEGTSNFLKRGTGILRHPIRNAIVAMLGVATTIPIQPVAHMDQLFSDHHLQCALLLVIDPLQIDENRMRFGVRQVNVRTAIAGRNTSAQPPTKDTSTCRDL